MSSYYQRRDVGPFYQNLPFRIPDLIQRVRREDRNGFDGVDARFAMEYMGRAEFEWGAMPNSLKAMRSASDLVVEKIEDHVPPDAVRPLWYVGRRAEIPRAEAIVYAEFDESDQKPPYLFKERLYMRERLLPHKYTYEARTDGWWALNGDTNHDPEFAPFAIFVDEEYALLWRSLLDQ